MQLCTIFVFAAVLQGAITATTPVDISHRADPDPLARSNDDGRTAEGGKICRNYQWAPGNFHGVCPKDWDEDLPIRTDAPRATSSGSATTSPTGGGSAGRDVSRVRSALLSSADVVGDSVIAALALKIPVWVGLVDRDSAVGRFMDGLVLGTGSAAMVAGLGWAADWYDDDDAPPVSTAMSVPGNGSGSAPGIVALATAFLTNAQKLFHKKESIDAIHIDITFSDGAKYSLGLERDPVTAKGGGEERNDEKTSGVTVLAE